MSPKNMVPQLYALEKKRVHSGLSTSSTIVQQVDEEQLIPFRAKPGLAVYYALVLCLLCIILLIICMAIPIPLTGFNIVLSSNGMLLYTASTTVLSGAIASFIAGEVKRLWLYDMLYIGTAREEGRIARWYRRLTRSTSNPHRQAKAALGLGTINDSIIYWPQTLSLLITGLTTTGLIAGVAPSIYEATSTVQWSVSPPRSEGQCFLTVNSDSSSNLFTESDPALYNWTLPDGSWLTSLLSARSSSGDCRVALRPVSQIVGTSQPDQGIAYNIGNLPVRPGAIGLPTLYNATAFSQIPWFAELWSYQDGGDTMTGIWGPGQPVGSEVCLPVLARNPVRCEAWTGSGVRLGGDESRLTFGDDCNATLKTGGRRSVNVCTAGLEVGQVAIAMGVVADDLTWSPATQRLYGLMEDFDGPWPILADGDNLTVKCEVDIRTSVDFRKVRFDYLGQVVGAVQKSANSIGGGHGSRPPPRVNGPLQFLVTGGETCVPNSDHGATMQLDQYLTPEVLAWAASGTFDILDEWRGKPDGNTSMLDQISYGYDQRLLSDGNGGTPNINGLFYDSRNRLEDILGTVHGIALGYIVSTSTACYSGDMSACMKDWEPMYPNDVIPASASFVNLPVTTLTATSMKVGAGQWWSFVCFLPLVFSFLLLSWLLKRRIDFGKNAIDGDGD